MVKKGGWILLFILILGSWIWGVAQWQKVYHRLVKLETEIAGITRTVQGESVSDLEQETGYKITVDMWQIFEKELQEYKQRLREGKRQYDEQQTSWNKLLTELKRTLQEYDKFIATEGEFWEKQLRNYEKLLSRNEERFEILGQAIEDLNGLMVEFQQWWDAQKIQLRPKETEEEIFTEEGEATTSIRRQRIKPRIKGRRKYETYPPVEEGEEEEEVLLEETGEVIRGTITGSGTYRTY